MENSINGFDFNKQPLEWLLDNLVNNLLNKPIKPFKILSLAEFITMFNNLPHGAILKIEKMFIPSTKGSRAGFLYTRLENNEDRTLDYIGYDTTSQLNTDELLTNFKPLNLENIAFEKIQIAGNISYMSPAGDDTYLSITYSIELPENIPNLKK